MNQSIAKKYSDATAYDIVNDDGTKVFVYIGYYYTEGEEETPGEDDTWRFADFTGADTFLADLLETFAQIEESTMVEDVLEFDNGYIYSMTEEEANKEVEQLFEGRQLLELYDLTEDTPCGRYYSSTGEVFRESKQRTM